MQAPAGAGAPDPSEPGTTPLAEPATAPLWGPAAPAEPVVPAPVAAPEGGAEAAVSPGPGAGEPGPAVVGQVLPMYFVGDESHSMAGEPIAAVNQGLIDLRDEVAKHPLIGKKVRFGIITFADSAQTRLELSELSEDLVLPTLSPRGRGTSYASALEALRQTIPADVALLKGARLPGPPSVGVLPQRRTADREGREVAGAPGRA